MAPIPPPVVVIAAAPVAARLADLVRILNGGALGDAFTPAFLAAVPEASLRAIAGQLTAAYGTPRTVARAEPAGAGSYALLIRYDRADVSATLTLDAADGRIAGLVITGAAARLASFAQAETAIAALPGSAGLAVFRLGASRPVAVAGIHADRALAVGSVFKLLILAELVRVVASGQRHWSDVVPLTTRSVPTGLLQAWPAGAPLTLHSLATLMISQSDNSAADTLIALLGRDAVAAMAGPLGWTPHPGNEPLLTTAEAAKLKGTSSDRLADRYAAADPATRRTLLANDVARRRIEDIDLAALMTRPIHVADIEWFASPAAIATSLDWFRRQPGDAGRTARAILAVNPGPAAIAGRFTYVGYKGGSDAGVMAAGTLLRSRRGVWYAVAAGWNDNRAPVAQPEFAAILTGVVQRIADLDEAASGGIRPTAPPPKP